MAGEIADPVCKKCGTTGMPSFLVLSPVVQYWRCPKCHSVWTTLKTTIEQRPFPNLSSDDARTHCPECRDPNVVDLTALLYSMNMDFFRCHACSCVWMVPKGQEGPATRVVFGKPNNAADSEEAG